MDNIVELARLFKDRDNPFSFGILTGTIESTSPPKLRISDEIIVSGSHLILTRSYYSSMLKGDEVIVVVSNDNQKYYVIDKAVRT